MPLVAQQAEGPSQTGASAILTVPAPLGGTRPALRPASEGEVSNVLSGGLNIGGFYDDNAITVSGQQGYGSEFFLLPSLRLQQARPRTLWSLDYRGGLTVEHNAPGTGPSLNAVTATADMVHAFSQRLLLELRQDYVMTNDPLNLSGQGQPAAALTGAGQINPYFVPPAGSRVANTASGNLVYQLTQHSSVGASGSYSTQRFRDVATASGTAPGLIDTAAKTGRAFYALQISRRQKVGFEYQLQDLRFQGDLARSVDQTVFLFDEISLKTNLTLTLFAGPDVTHTHNNVLLQGANTAPTILPIINNLWAPAGGAMFTWRGKLAAFSLSGQRVVSDGSGSIGATRATSASAELRKDFTRRWSASFGYTYSDGRLLESLANAANGKITANQGTLALERRLAESLVVRAQYARVQQSSAGAPAPLITGNHNRVGLELDYRFTRPLGR